MRTLLNLIPARSRRVPITLVLILLLMRSYGQICSDPSNVIYGLSNAGFLHSLNVNTGVVGPAINPPYTGNPPSQSNGVGYNSLNGMFYYFKRMPNVPPTEFVSFDPATNAVTILSSPVTANAMYIGCVTPDGTGYYCWDSQARLFYYNIPSDTWTMITSSIVDQFGKDVDSIFRLHGSGDAAVAGNGSLMMLPSSNTRYGLFTLNAPLPTSAVASVSVTQVVAMTPPPAKFVGIALNNTGQIFLVTSTDRLYRLENDLSLTFLSAITLAMADLTSCNFPLAMLPASYNNFTATLQNNKVNIIWKASEENTAKTYTVEHSLNNMDWVPITAIKEIINSSNKISFIHNTPTRGRNYYRLRVESSDKKITYSQVRTVDYEKTVSYSAWPNPARNNIYIQNSDNSNVNSLLVIFDQSGNKIKGAKLNKGINNIDIKSLTAGRYFVNIQASNGEVHTYKIIKN